LLKPVAYDDLTEKYLPMPDPMVGWFKILTTIYTEKDFDTKTKMHKKVVRFHVEPYKVHILNFTVPGLGGNSLWVKQQRKITTTYLLVKTQR
jgi:hypothetical protein